MPLSFSQNHHQSITQFHKQSDQLIDHNLINILIVTPSYMAITHEHIARRRTQVWRTHTGGGGGTQLICSHLAVFLVGFSIVCALVTFVLCLAGEALRSEATWYPLSIGGSTDRVSECFYSSSGATALACAICAFLFLAVAMFTEHAYMLVAVATPHVPPGEIGWTTSNADLHAASTPPSTDLLSCSLFLLTWLCFAIAEVLLIISIGVESGHLTDWRKPRSACHVMRPGMFAAAGIVGFISVFLGFMAYLTALRSHRLHRGEGVVHHGVHTTSVTHRDVPAAPTTPTAPQEPHPPVSQMPAPVEAEKTATSV